MIEKSEYKTIYEWKKADPNMFDIARKNFSLIKICEHFGWPPPNPKRKGIKPSGYWDVKENCIKEAKKYKYPEEWKKGHEGSHSKACRNGWYYECSAHMTKQKQRPSGYWNVKERCIEEARKHKTSTEWQKSSGPSFLSARRNGWLDECWSHMTNKKTTHPKGYWNDKDTCFKSILECETKGEWFKVFNGAYQSARRNGWLDEIYSFRGWKGK